MTPTDSPFEFAEFDPENIPAKPADWAPSWERWHATLHGIRREKARAEHWEKRATETGKALQTLQTTHDTEIGTLRQRTEAAEIRAIPGLVEPDVEIIRSRYAADTRDTPEAKRPTLSEWAAGQVKAATEEPDKAPRWLRGYLGEPAQEQAPEAPPEPAPTGTPKGVPRDTTRRPPPPPKNGFSAEDISAMSLEQYKAHKQAGNISLDALRGRR